MRDLVIKAEHLSVFVKVGIPIILLLLNIFQFYYPHCYSWGHCEKNESIRNEVKEVVTTPKAEAKEEPVVQIIPPNDTETETTQTNTTPVVNTTNTTTAVNTTASNLSTGTLPITGKIGLTIDDVVYENKVTWAKVTKIKYTIINQKAAFAPKILVYAYDETYSEQDKGVVEETLTPADSLAGTSVTNTATVSITLAKLDLEKTIKIDLYDATKEDDIIVTKTYKKKYS
jgi:hypothetical protein